VAGVTLRFRIARQVDASRQRWICRPGSDASGLLLPWGHFLRREVPHRISDDREQIQDDVLGVIGEQPDACVTELENALLIV
jgi:hypothetical protein